MLVKYIYMAEGECGIPSSNFALTPLDAGFYDVEAFVGSAWSEELCDGHGLFADATADVKDVMIGLEVAVFDEGIQKLIVAEAAAANKPKTARRDERISSACQKIEDIQGKISGAADGQARFKFGKCAFRQNCELQYGQLPQRLRFQTSAMAVMNLGRLYKSEHGAESHS